jgi:hypothetical protein
VNGAAQAHTVDGPPPPAAPPAPDNAPLQAELAAALADAPASAPPLDALGAPPLDPVAGWREFVAPTTAIVVAGILPQWDISAAEQEGFTAALSECLAQLFPDGINGRYACWFRLLAVTGGAVAVRAMSNGGKLPPIGPRRPPPLRTVASAAPDHAREV